MTHTYELRKFKGDGSMVTVLKLVAEPKQAKQRAEEYAKKNPALYSLEKLETIKIFCTEEA